MKKPTKSRPMMGKWLLAGGRQQLWLARALLQQLNLGRWMALYNLVKAKDFEPH
jgi:hypothetical protein